MVRGYVRLERPGAVSGSQVDLFDVDRNYELGKINSSPRVNRKTFNNIFLRLRLMDGLLVTVVCN